MADDFHKPTRFPADRFELIVGGEDPAQIVRAAHETAHAIVDRGRGSDDPAIVERLVAYTDAHGIKPQVPGMSETIRVRSVLGRYLEHSRIFAFHNDGDPQVFIGSADMMHRNLDRRVEALVSITDPVLIAQLEHNLDLAMSDDTASWHLDSDGAWTRHHLADDGSRDAQPLLLTAREPRSRPVEAILDLVPQVRAAQ